MSSHRPTGNEPPAAGASSGNGAVGVLTSLCLPIYLPAILVQTGVGMLVPVLPLYLREEGLSFTLVAVVMATAGVGSMLSQLPTGMLLGKRTEREVMVLSVVVLAISTLLLGFTGLAIALAGLRLVWGVGSTGWLLTRQTLMTRAAPPEVRGRAMSLLGGTQRLGILLGAVLGGYLADRYGFSTAFAAVAGLTALAIVPLLADRNPLTSSARPVPSPPGGLFGGFKNHPRLLLLAGSGQVATIAVRSGRQVVLPLIGASLGLNPSEVGLLVGIGSLADLVLFPLAGFIMDRFGRLFAIVPAFTGLGIGFLMLAAAEDYFSVAVAATVIGLANSIGSGTMLTLASDLAPPESPSQFLAALGTIRESGKILGPVLVGALADVAGLAQASAALGVLALAATALIAFGIGETRDRVPTQAVADATR